jgi:uncharacterized protein
MHVSVWPRSPWPRRAALTGATAVLFTGLLAAPALAHVTVRSDNATRGAQGATITFKVPTESDTATTTKLQVELPTTSPLIGVTPQDRPGWKIDVATSPLNPPVKSGDDSVTDTVTEITWTAAAPSDAIPPNTFSTFAISVGIMPTTPSVTFKALQTYSGGQVVRWIGVAQPGQPEPDNPAPVLTLAPAGASGTGSSAGVSSASGPGVPAAPAQASTGTTTSGSDTTARVLAIVAIVLAVVLGAGGFAAGFVAGRRRPASALRDQP